MEKKNYKQPKCSTQQNGVSISREAWLAESKALADQIKKNHGDQMIDVDRIIELDKQELEVRYSSWLEE